MTSRRALVGVSLALALLLSACGGSASEETEPAAATVDPAEIPVLGDCRVLTPEDVAESFDASPTVDCAAEHTAQTYAVGTMPEALSTADYDDPAVARFAFDTCTERFRKFLGADESMAMRTVLSWAYFRPPPDAWAEGARWYRCDLVGGNDDATSYVALPETAEGLLQDRPDDQWLLCVAGPTVSGQPRVPCSEPHDWRAVTTIKVPEDKGKYPGDRLVEVTSRDFCKQSVGAWLNYPPTYNFGYTWFHEAEWEAGNRRSVCWAQTAD